MSLRPLERVIRRAPLALRLQDLATGQPVHDRARVSCWPQARPDLRVDTTAVTSAGIAGFTRLPGLGSFEDGSTTRDDWFASPLVFAPKPFVVRVDDLTGDHLRTIRSVLVPAATPIDVALPRSPVAPIPAGNLSIAAQLVTDSGQPASWAAIEISVGGYTTGGVADVRGVVVVPLPRAVPPTTLGTPATGPVWRVSVRVRYRLADQVIAPGSSADDPPTLTSLFLQLPALLSDGGALVGSLQRDLTTGGPLVVASLASPSPSVLVIRPAP